jgi:hypothetical protein
MCNRLQTPISSYYSVIIRLRNYLTGMHGHEKTIFRLAKIVLGIALLLGGMRSCSSYINWSAEREAQALCDSMPIGSDIIPTISKFEKDIGFVKQPGEKETICHYGYPDSGPYTDGHRFMFFGMWMDKAYCDVSLTQDGKVKAKNVYLQEDYCPVNYIIAIFREELRKSIWPYGRG